MRLGKSKCGATVGRLVGGVAPLLILLKCWLYFSFFCPFNFSTVGRDRVTHNGLGLCEGGEIEAQMFNLAQMLIRIPMLKFSTIAPLLQNPCYALVPFFVCSFRFFLSCRGALAW